MESQYVSSVHIQDLLGEEKTKMWTELYYFLMDRYHLEVIWNQKVKYGRYECKFKAGDKTLCTFYFDKDKLVCLLILGQTERDAFEEMRVEFTDSFLKLYDNTSVLHDGKWISYELLDVEALDNVKKVILLKKKPNNKLSICGYCCDRCKANRASQKKKDERELISSAWHKYYGFYIPPEECNCDGCLCKKKDSVHLDAGCQIRECHIEHKIDHCYECSEYPCELFEGRRGLSVADAKEKLGEEFNEQEYMNVLDAFDNYNRNMRLRR